MRMKALDSFHASDVGMLHAKTEFEVSDARGAEIAKRGLAIQVADGPAAIETTDAPKVEETTSDIPQSVGERPDDAHPGEQIDGQGLAPAADRPRRARAQR